VDRHSKPPLRYLKERMYRGEGILRGEEGWDWRAFEPSGREEGQVEEIRKQL